MAGVRPNDVPGEGRAKGRGRGGRFLIPLPPRAGRVPDELPCPPGRRPGPASSFSSTSISSSSSSPSHSGIRHQVPVPDRGQVRRLLGSVGVPVQDVRPLPADVLGGRHGVEGAGRARRRRRLGGGRRGRRRGREEAGTDPGALLLLLLLLGLLGLGGDAIGLPLLLLARTLPGGGQGGGEGRRAARVEAGVRQPPRAEAGGPLVEAGTGLGLGLGLGRSGGAWALRRTGGCLGGWWRRGHRGAQRRAGLEALGRRGMPWV